MGDQAIFISESETLEGLRTMKEKSIQAYNSEELIDITTIKIDTKRTKEEKMLNFIKRVKNPYLFKVGDVAVRVVFNENGLSFQELFEELIKSNMEK